MSAAAPRTKARSPASRGTGWRPRTAAPANPIPSMSKAANLSSMRHFCTLFDHNYIDRGLALHRSLVRYCADFTLHVLCLDAPTLHVLRALALPRTELIAIESLEQADNELRGACNDRMPLEFYFTCKPVLLGYILDRNASVGRLEYLDADLYFFSGPSTAEEEYAESAVALSPHRFNTLNAGRARYGRFNAGWISVSA